MTCAPEPERRDAVLAYCEARDRGDEKLVRELEGRALEANLGLARATSLRTCGRRDEDFEQAAAVGLLKSLRSYDPQRAKLSTHAWPRMRRQAAALAESTALPVRVPAGTYRKTRQVEAEAARAGVPLAEAAKRLGISARTVQRGLVRRCGVDERLAAADDPEDVLEREEQGQAVAAVVSCWRQGTPELLAAAASGLGARADALAKAGAKELARALWPEQAEARLEALARLDAALWLLEQEHGLDARLWRAHVVEGRQWTELAAEQGVTRQRVTHRARRREPRLAELLKGLAGVSRRGLELWAQRPPIVEALEELGVSSAEAEPIEVEYAVEDLEVALTEIDEGQATAWSARHVDRCSWLEVRRRCGCSASAARALAARAAAALRELLAPQGLGPVLAAGEQLELDTDQSSIASACWWTPIVHSRPRRWGRCRMARGGAAPRAPRTMSRARPRRPGPGPAQLGDPMLRELGPPAGARAPPVAP